MKLALRVLLIVLVVAAIAAIVGTAGGDAAVRIHLMQETGISNSASRAYNFWSGFAGSNVLVLFSLAYWYWHHTCHHSGWDLRLGHPTYEGSPYLACHKHHPGRLDEHRAKRHVGADVMREDYERHVERTTA